MKSVSPRIRFHPPLEGEDRSRMTMSDRGGVILSVTVHPTPSRIPLRAMLADPPSPGEDGTPALATVQPDPIVP